MPVPRLHVPLPMSPGLTLALPASAARHVQVLRLQPGEPVLLFNGDGGEHEATVQHMGRSEVTVTVGAHRVLDRELPVAVTLAVGMPANDRMDTVVEKATELGVAVIQPLVCERSVLRLSGERAARRREHWQGVAVAAAEQSGRTRVPAVAPVLTLPQWLQASPAGALRLVLSPIAEAPPLRSLALGGEVVALSGPEGGLSSQEEAAARAAGYQPLRLGERVLRADTAPLALMAWIALQH